MNQNQNQNQVRIMLINLHGLVKGDRLEIGRDADNGGQTRYVFELAEYLSKHPQVAHVHLFTRLIDDPAVSPAYAVPIEILNEKLDIRRISFGGKKYNKKEDLWDHLDDFVSGAIHHIKAHGIFPDWISSHYADAGYAASEISRILKVPFSHTAHSLGRAKRDKMTDIGLTEAEGEKLFRFKRRIQAEEDTLKYSEFIITSTEQEIETYEMYENYALANYNVLAPGVDTYKFAPYYVSLMKNEQAEEEALQRKFWVGEYIEKFLSHPNKPVILALSRPDRRKNLHTLIEVYGQEKELQSMANLVIFAGIRKDINTMHTSEREVLTEILLLMDKYDLYGKLAIPKKHDIENEVATIYQYSAEKRGIFVNLTLHENFGLTIIEAASAGLPVVATNSGGPTEILPKCNNGILVDPMNREEIKQAIIELISDEEKWRKCSNEGILNVKKYYSWENHVDTYMQWVQDSRKLMQENHAGEEVLSVKNTIRLQKMDMLFATDIDGTLISEAHGHPGLETIIRFLQDRPQNLGFALATGRNFRLVRDFIDTHDIPSPDFIISSVGTEIYYVPPGYIMDKSWGNYLSKRWKRDLIEMMLRSVPWLELQEEEAQNPFKISYYVSPGSYDEGLLRKMLKDQWHHLSVIFSHDAFLDILPKRASKGKALRYISNKWSIPLKNIIAAGDSGNDLDMLTGAVKGILVGNRSSEMSMIKPQKDLYLAESPAAEGVCEGLRHYGLTI